ncbi:hypothetical protein Hanom_Chr01g00061621 [Helianthus anomalus]
MLHIEQNDLQSQGSIMMPSRFTCVPKGTNQHRHKDRTHACFWKKEDCFKYKQEPHIHYALQIFAQSHAVLWSCMTCTPNFLIPFDSYLYMCRSGIWLITILTAHSKLELEEKRDRFLCLQSVEFKYCPCMIEPT